MILQLLRRDLLAQYKKSLLGYAWLVIAPILEVAIWVLLQWTSILQPGEVGVPYPVYVFLGMTVWYMFKGFYWGAASTLSVDTALLLNISFPHEVICIKQTLFYVAGSAIRLGLAIILMLCRGVIPSWGVLVLPLVALPLFFLGSAAGLCIALVSIVAPGIRTVMEFAMNFLMFTTPLIYSNTPDSMFLRAMIRFNPLTYLVCSCREVILYGKLYHAPGYFVCSFAAFAVFLLAARLFFVSEKRLIERIT